MADLTSQAVSDPLNSDGILSDKDVVQLFAPLTAFKSLLIAVSGGADSVALMNMLHRWRGLVVDPPALEVATIDHDLRPGSGDEVRWVADQARVLGLAHRSKVWTDDKPTSGLQAAARSARYRLLLEIISDQSMLSPTAIVTAHTQDDQAETVAMRLARGSGVDGLGAMANCRPLKGDGAGVMLVRPLLGISKSRLMAFLKAHNQTWLEDPSNASRDFERVRLRQARPHFAALGLTSDALARSALRARRARAALDQVTSDFLNSHVALNNGVLAELEGARFSAQPDEIQIRVLTSLLAVFGGRAPKAQLREIENLQAGLVDAKSAMAATLGGCIISKQSGVLRIFREAGRAGLPVVDLEPGVPRKWDNRFNVSFHCQQHGGPSALQVRALGGAAFAAIRGHLNPPYAQLRAAAAQTVPSFWHGDQLVAVPTLKVSASQMQKIRLVGHGAGATTGNCQGTDVGEAEQSDPTGHEVCTETQEMPCSEVLKAVIQADFIGLAE